MSLWWLTHDGQLLVKRFKSHQAKISTCSQKHTKKTSEQICMEARQVQNVSFSCLIKLFSLLCLWLDNWWGGKRFSRIILISSLKYFSICENVNKNILFRGRFFLFIHKTVKHLFQIKKKVMFLNWVIFIFILEVFFVKPSREKKTKKIIICERFYILEIFLEASSYHFFFLLKKNISHCLT